MRSLIAVLLAASFLVPAASSHGAATVLDNEVLLLNDEGEDAFYAYDGYDLFDLYVREAFFEDLRAGLIFRYTLYGGYSAAPAADALHIDLTVTGPDGPQTFRMSTSDDQTWTGDMVIIESQIEPDLGAYTSQFQVFLPLAALNATVGDTISNFTMESYAGSDLLDRAPGGYFAPGSGGLVEVPAESTRLVDALALAGPVGYTSTEYAVAGKQVTFTVSPLITSTGQHIQSHHRGEGWNVTRLSPPQASIEPDQTASFAYELRPTAGAQPLRIEVLSDLGGKEDWYVSHDGNSLVVSQDVDTLAAAMTDSDKGAPGLGLLVILWFLVGAAWTRRR